jgi:hypothetical protein
MATLTPAELEIVNGFAEHIMEGNRLNTGDPREKIRSRILEQKYGTAAVDDAFPVIDWDRFFDENVCPLCGNQIEFRNDVYACRGCGLTIPLRLYERARERNRQEKEHQRKGYELSLKVKDAGLREDRMDELYRLGVKRAQEKLQVAEVCADEPA